MMIYSTWLDLNVNLSGCRTYAKKCSAMNGFIHFNNSQPNTYLNCGLSQAGSKRAGCGCYWGWITTGYVWCNRKTSKLSQWETVMLTLLQDESSGSQQSEINFYSRSFHFLNAFEELFLQCFSWLLHLICYSWLEKMLATTTDYSGVLNTLQYFPLECVRVESTTHPVGINIVKKLNVKYRNQDNPHFISEYHWVLPESDMRRPESNPAIT